MLNVLGLSVSYGKHIALSDISLSVDAGEIVVILGANGAGKSSLLRAIAGISSGSVTGKIDFLGSEILDHDSVRFRSDEIVNSGISFVPEGRGIFGDLTVRENLMLGAYPRRARSSLESNLRSVLDMFPVLRDRRGQIARTMSGGEQQMVAIGRALMSEPRIIMLDEPSLGLSPILSREVFGTLSVIRSHGIGVLMVEQNATLSLALADRGYIIETGRLVAEDSAVNLRTNPAVQSAYLGGGGSS